MKKILFSFCILFFAFNSFAQNSIFELMERTDISLQEAERIAQRHFDTVGTGRGSGYKQFQRWLYERKFHTDENGNFISLQTDWNNYQQSLQSLNSNNIVTAGNWTELGPWGWNRTSGWNPGTGRLTALAIHPANESVIYVGSPGGGIWKSVNAGSTWQPLTDNNSLWMSVFALTIDPTDQNIVYAGTSGSGILKSTNAGATWAPAGAGPTGTIRKILIHPSAPNTVFACASNGIFRSTNGGTSWTQVHTVSKEDIEFKPDDPTIMYATGNDVVRSTNNGLTWTSVGAAQGITNTGRTLVAVSPANPNYVYIVQASGSLFGRMYKSTDAGISFITTVVGNPASGTNYFGYETNGTGTTGQATYDMAIDISPVNAAEVYIAGIICWKSVDEATSFTALTAWSLPNTIGYNHADVHGLFWINSTIYSLSDGGIYKSTDNGDNWTDLSTGLGIRQFYRIANSKTNATVITGGAQDNGSVAKQASGTWVDWLGADGMEGLVSPTNHLNIWGTSQNGSIYRSTNGGNSYTGLPRPSPGQWVTPLAIHPTNETILYGGWTGVYKSTNSGASWTNIGAGTITVTLADLAVAPSDPNYIYASTGTTLYVTTNDGATWTTRTAPSTINDIAVDPTDPNKIWIACNSTSNRIMVSTDAGATFTNISANLPAIVARAVVVDDNTPRGIYVGMNIGVYFREEGTASWTNFSDNLPLVAINELDIQKAAGKIRVATYGRGVWESPVAVAVPPSGFTFTNPAPVSATCPAPTSLSITLGTNSVGGFTNPVTLSATAGVPAGTNISFGTNPVTPGSSSVVNLNNANTLPAGSYIITITGTATGATTQTVNLTYTITAGTGPVITTQPISQAVCAGANTSFSIASAGANTFQWQVSTDGGNTFANLSNSGVYSGVTSAALSITGATAVLNNYYYRCIAATQCGSTTSNSGILTVSTGPVITSQPVASTTLCAGGGTIYTVTATGTGLTYQWQLSTTGAGGPWNNIINGGVYSGTTTASLTVTGVIAAMNNSVYRCVITSSACSLSSNSNTTLLNVNTPPVITTHPVASTSICAAGSASFSIAASDLSLTYQWQESTNGGASWNNIINGGVYAGATTSTLTLTNITAAMNSNRYRAVVTGAAPCGPVSSNSGILNVTPQPVITASSTAIFPGKRATLTININPVPGLTFSWYLNNVLVPGATGNSIIVSVTELGNYKVVVSNGTGTCQSGVITITAMPRNKLFIFPIPNNGIFKVSYYAAGASVTNPTKQSITIYNSYGQRVHNEEYVITQPYQLNKIDMRRNGKGVYYVVLREANGNKVETGEVIVR
jgi:hypothetical protein